MKPDFSGAAPVGVGEGDLERMATIQNMQPNIEATRRFYSSPSFSFFNLGNRTYCISGENLHKRLNQTLSSVHWEFLHSAGQVSILMAALMLNSVFPIYGMVAGGLNQYRKLRALWYRGVLSYQLGNYFWDQLNPEAQQIDIDLSEGSHTTLAQLNMPYNQDQPYSLDIFLDDADETKPCSDHSLDCLLYSMRLDGVYQWKMTLEKGAQNIQHELFYIDNQSSKTQFSTWVISQQNDNDKNYLHRVAGVLNTFFTPNNISSVHEQFGHYTDISCAEEAITPWYGENSAFIVFENKEQTVTNGIYLNYLSAKNQIIASRLMVKPGDAIEVFMKETDSIFFRNLLLPKQTMVRIPSEILTIALEIVRELITELGNISLGYFSQILIQQFNQLGARKPADVNHQSSVMENSPSQKNEQGEEVGAMTVNPQRVIEICSGSEDSNTFPGRKIRDQPLTNPLTSSLAKPLIKTLKSEALRVSCTPSFPYSKVFLTMALEVFKAMSVNNQAKVLFEIVGDQANNLLASYMLAASPIVRDLVLQETVRKNNSLEVICRVAEYSSNAMIYRAGMLAQHLGNQKIANYLMARFPYIERLQTVWPAYPLNAQSRKSMKEFYRIVRNLQLHRHPLGSSFYIYKAKGNIQAERAIVIAHGCELIYKGLHINNSGAVLSFLAPFRKMISDNNLDRLLEEAFSAQERIFPEALLPHYKLAKNYNIGWAFHMLSNPENKNFGSLIEFKATPYILSAIRNIISVDIITVRKKATVDSYTLVHQLSKMHGNPYKEIICAWCRNLCGLDNASHTYHANIMKTNKFYDRISLVFMEVANNMKLHPALINTPISTYYHPMTRNPDQYLDILAGANDPYAVAIKEIINSNNYD